MARGQRLWLPGTETGMKPTSCVDFGASIGLVRIGPEPRVRKTDDGRILFMVGVAQGSDLAYW